MTRPEKFKRLHTSGPGFIMPNVWDVGSAIVLAAEGFPAIATTSSGIAFSLGKQDYNVNRPDLRLSRDETLARARSIVDAVSIPVSCDLEAGFGDRPEEVAETVRLAMEAGLSGGNIEDRNPARAALYDEPLAVERIAAARETIDNARSDFVLTARCDAILHCRDGIESAVRRSNLYRAAGADCLFTPGTSDLSVIGRLAAEIEGPLNMVLGLGNADGNAQEWIAAGVQRVSLGGAIARTALGVVRAAARELKTFGTIGFARGQIQQPELNDLFETASAKD